MFLANNLNLTYDILHQSSKVLVMMPDFKSIK